MWERSHGVSCSLYSKPWQGLPLLSLNISTLFLCALLCLILVWHIAHSLGTLPAVTRLNHMARNHMWTPPHFIITTYVQVLCSNCVFFCTFLKHISYHMTSRSVFLGHRGVNVRGEQISHSCSHQHERGEQSITCRLQYHCHSNTLWSTVWGQSFLAFQLLFHDEFFLEFTETSFVFVP